jgi:hypothetical protein
VRFDFSNIRTCGSIPSSSMARSPIDMVAETLNLDRSVIAGFPKNRPDVLPA